MIRVHLGLSPLFLVLVLVLVALPVRAEITFTYMQAEDLVETYLGDPNGIVQFRNIESSNHSCYALFANGHSTKKNTTTNEYLIPDRGIILSTGSPSDFTDNDSSETTTDFGVETGDPALDSLFLNETRVFDPCYIEFEFQCPPESEISIPTVSLDYIFGSEEYYGKDHDGDELDVASEYKDAFGVFLNGENIALIPDGKDGVPVTVNNINSQVNSERYIENELVGSRGSYTSQHVDIEPDGFTKKLKVSAEAMSGWNLIKLVIGDVGDGSLDSVVLLAGSLSCAEGADISSNSSGKPITLRPITLPDKISGIQAPRLFQIPMPIAVAIVALLGLIGISMAVVGLSFYQKRLKS